jgi:TPR repeat protein
LANQNFPESIYYLGQAYADDNKLTASYSQYSQAAKKNYPPALYAVGDCSEHGKGCTKSNKLAVSMYTKAATAGNKASMLRLGLAELNGELGLRKNINNAVKWFKRGAAGNF